VDRRRYLANVLLFVATLFLLGAVANGSWWQTELVSISPVTHLPYQHVLIQFRLGGSVACSTLNWWDNATNPCLNVSSQIQGVRGTLYWAADGIVVALLVAFALATVLTTLGNFGITFGRLQLTILLFLVLGLFLLGTVTLTSTAVVGPGSQASAYCSTLSADASGCPIFWGGTVAGVIPGGCAGCTNTEGWGGGFAYYYTLVATAMSVFAWWLLWDGRRGPYSKEEQAVWSAHNRPYSLHGSTMGGLTAAGPSVPLTPPSAYTRPIAPVVPSRVSIPTKPWTCPACGRVNSPWAGQCSVCRGDRPAG
jgi:hypothetical protein